VVRSPLGDALCSARGLAPRLESTLLAPLRRYALTRESLATWESLATGEPPPIWSISFSNSCTPPNSVDGRLRCDSRWIVSMHVHMQHSCGWVAWRFVASAVGWRILLFGLGLSATSSLLGPCPHLGHQVSVERDLL